jgi:amino acid adenylation domain-containing protein
MFHSPPDETAAQNTALPSVSPARSHSPSALFQQLQCEILSTPEARIIASDGQVTSYRDLLGRLSQIAAHLPCALVSATPSAPSQDRVVAICTEKNPAGLAAVLAVLGSGQAYAPLDPTHPVARLRGILETLNPCALLVDASTCAALADWSRDREISVIDISTLPAPRKPAALPPSRRQPQELAAVLHTSGSTGKPKRVEIDANALHVFQDWAVDELSLRFDDCLMSHAPFAFDLSFLDIYAGLMAGADLVLADAQTARNGAQLLKLLDSCNVTVWHSAPSALKLLVDAAEKSPRRPCLPQMRAVLFAGEPMPDKTLKKLFDLFPNARFLNIYGCTETNDTFFYDVPRKNTPAPLPLGRKLPYVDYLIVGPDGQPQTGPCQGELLVRCPTMMRRYGAEELTARAMVPYGGHRYFRSGDQVRRDTAGYLHYVGRNDSIVKLNGVRMDLNEVEALLLSHPLVEEAACFLIEPTPGAERQLRARVTVKTCEPENTTTLSTLDLRKHLGACLPAAALPRSYKISDQPLPKNSNGKICRKQLAALALEIAP